jgi:hypothetical protein
LPLQLHLIQVLLGYDSTLYLVWLNEGVVKRLLSLEQLAIVEFNDEVHVGEYVLVGGLTPFFEDVDFEVEVEDVFTVGHNHGVHGQRLELEDYSR